MSLSSSETEGGENTDDELSSTDLDSSYNGFNNYLITEEHHLQPDIHQIQLIAIHMTEKLKKGEGELNGLKYMKVCDVEHDAYDEDISDDDAYKAEKIEYKLNKKQKMVMFPLPTYYGNDTMMVASYLTSAIFIFSLIVIIPIINEVITPFNMVLVVLATIFAAVGVFLDGKYYLNFNYDTNEIYLQQKMCVGNCICGNKGAQGKLLGTFERFASAHKIKLDDVIGENTWERWQFAIEFKDFDGDDFNVLFTTTNEAMIDGLEQSVNEWWGNYKKHNENNDANNLRDYH